MQKQRSKVSIGDYNNFFTCVAFYSLQKVSAYAIYIANFLEQKKIKESI